MGNRFAFRLVFSVLLIAAIAGVGFYAYSVGVAHGIAESTRAVSAPGNGAPIVVWPRPWGFGYGFFPFFPLFFILFWLFALRGLFWRGGWWGRGYGHVCVSPGFDEWHRRAHAQPGAPPASGANA